MIEATIKIKLTGSAEESYRNFLRHIETQPTATEIGEHLKEVLYLEFMSDAGSLDLEGLSILVEHVGVT